MQPLPDFQPTSLANALSYGERTEEQFADDDDRVHEAPNFCPH